MFLYAPNIVSDSLKTDLLPWDFKPTEEITAQIRAVKEDRQAWYRREATSHYFYTLIEPLNPNLRVSKETNPPHNVWGFAADYDMPVPDDRIDEALAAMSIRPSWVERSLSGNFRLVWLLKSPMRVASADFCVFIMQKAQSWLQLSVLPGLDVDAFERPTQLYCNGCKWRNTGFGPIPDSDAQSFFVACGREFRFKGAVDDANVPLDTVEPALKEKFPAFNWPGPFELETQGPSFWIPGSTSPNSAIIKPGGMFTFAAHAEKPFYAWSDLLGPEFLKNFQNSAISKATMNCFYDNRRYYRLVEEHYVPADKDDFTLYLKVDCKLSTRAGSSGVSPVEVARQHIHNHNRITNAGPFVFRRPGVIDFMGERRLNTYSAKPIQPSTGTQTWGPQGNFPFLSLLLDSLFDPTEPQKWHFLAWFQYYYRAAFEWLPLAGQYITLSGGVGCGKGLLNRRVIGTAVGGFADASSHLVYADPFNSHLMKVPHWVLDDDSPSSGSPGGARKAAAMFKKMAANQQFLCNEKFQVAGMVEWMGRIAITTNLDFTSLRIIGTMDNNSLDKLCLFKCVDKRSVTFPGRYEIDKIIDRELPHLLRWLLDFTPPDFIIPDSRFGWEAYHNAFLMERTHQGSTVAPFKELLIDALVNFFQDTPEAAEFTGTVTQIHRMIISTPGNEQLMRSYKTEQINRYLEQLQSERLLPCAAGDGLHRSRVWTFPRFEGIPASTNNHGVDFSTPQ